jgi:hypothetical protein
MTLQYKFVSDNLNYDGSQLKSLFAYLNFGLLGDSVVAFIGPCEIPFEHMVDGEDFLDKSEIRGDLMLHFIIEEFGKDLELAVTRQRLLASLVFEKLTSLFPNKKISRSGDDIFVGDGKLSISIATVSPVSFLIHFAMNISNEGTPVKTSCLRDLDINPRTFADELGALYLKEVHGISQACRKVHWVK